MACDLTVAMYLIPSVILTWAANRSGGIRRKIGWRAVGERNRPESFRTAQVAVLASLSIGKPAEVTRVWRS